MTRYTRDDVKRIANSIRQAKGTSRPYVFLVGAGISVTAEVPLAGQLVAQIARDYAPQVALLPEADRTHYGKVMGQLTPRERRDVLQPVMENAKINWANIALASMLKGGFIEKCLTLNFDNVLERACGLVGYYPAVYDFGLSPSERVSHIVSGSIIHLHGQSYGLVMLNSDEETKRHADAVTPLIQSVLTNRGMVVIGYSGDSDNIFPVLRRNHDGSDRLYWIGHADNCAQHVADLVSRPTCYTEYLGGVDADTFLIQLATELGCWPPTILHRPYLHLLEEIKDVVDYPKDLAQFGDLVGQLRSHLSEWEEWRKPKETVADLEALLLQGNYTEVLARADKSDPAQNDLAAWAEIRQGIALSTMAELQNDQELYFRAFSKYNEAITIKPDSYEALCNWGDAYCNLALLTKEPDYYEKACSKYAAAVKIKPDSYEAHNNWGNALFCLADLKGDQKLYDEACAKYIAGFAIRPDSHAALDNWGYALLRKFSLTGDKNYLGDAIDKCTRAEQLSKKPSYNLACAYAHSRDEERCREQLIACRNAGTLPKGSYILTDDDLAVYKHQDWLTELANTLDSRP